MKAKHCTKVLWKFLLIPIPVSCPVPGLLGLLHLHTGFAELEGVAAAYIPPNRNVFAVWQRRYTTGYY